MIRIDPVEAIPTVVLLSLVAAFFRAIAVWILGVPLVLTALLSSAVSILSGGGRWPTSLAWPARSGFLLTSDSL